MIKLKEKKNVIPVVLESSDSYRRESAGKSKQDQFKKRSFFLEPGDFSAGIPMLTGLMGTVY